MELLGAVIVVALALVTASVAETKGQSGLLWFVLGLFFPGVSLLIAALLDPTGDADPVVTSVEEAVRSSSVARALHGAAPQSAHGLQGQVGEGEREVLRQLSALEQLGLADRDADGRWALTERGAHHLGASNDV